MSEDVFVHETSYVDENVSVGKGTKIWHYSHVIKGASIGKRCTLGQNVMVGEGVKIGDDVKIQNNVSVHQGVTLEDEVFCGPSMVFTNVNNPRSGFPTDQEDYLETKVRHGATIGANATVVCGNELGKYCFIGAGSVVTVDVPAYAIVYGVPAKVNGWACKCGTRLNFSEKKAKCSRCNRRYVKEAQEAVKAIEEE